MESSQLIHYASGWCVHDAGRTATVKESQVPQSPHQEGAAVRGQHFHSGSVGLVKSEGLRLS